MKRGDFLKGIGLAGIGSMLPLDKAKAVTAGLNKGTVSCTLIPQETEGPYPFDLSGNQSMYRQDITEGNAGTPLTLTLTFLNVNDNCNPVTNARVDIWHCNKDGYYSEYANQPGYLGTQSHTNETFFRGIQVTDSNGVVTFKTIYPGWYTGRTTHIHFQLFLNSVLKATSQLAFPDSLNTTVYNTSNYSAHGQNTSIANNAADNVFSDTANTQYELLTVTANSTTGGYDAGLTVGVDVPSTGVINLTPETGRQFVFSQNYPNPFTDVTNISFSLLQSSDVKIEIYDLTGRKVAEPLNAAIESGVHRVEWNTSELPAGNYACQLNVENKDGVYKQVKLMTKN